jgi:hypothetical protein
LLEEHSLRSELRAIILRVQPNLFNQINVMLPVQSRLKNILLRGRPKSPLQLAPSRPGRGALAIVTNVGAGCGGRGSVGRVVVFAGRALVRERTQRADDRRGCVRQSRVVLAPVAGVKLAEVRRPNRV